MQIHIRAIGKMKEPGLSGSIDTYTKRLPWKIKIFEHIPKSGSSNVQEGAWLLSDINRESKVIALDECGKMLSSDAFAMQISSWQQHTSSLTFLIGGADGLSEEVKKRANMLLSLSAMTWPHLFARVMLMEQLYRAYTIIANHPYHRA